MSDIDAVQSIAMVAPRPVDVTRWLLLDSSDCREHEIKPAVLRQFGEVTFYIDITPELCGAIFAAESNHSISPYAGGLLQYFFKRDGNEARIFEFCKFTHHFFARRPEEVRVRISPID